MYNVQIEIGMGGCRFELLLTLRQSLCLSVSLGGSCYYLAWHLLKSFRKLFCFSRTDSSHGPISVSHIIPNKTKCDLEKKIAFTTVMCVFCDVTKDSDTSLLYHFVFSLWKVQRNITSNDNEIKVQFMQFLRDWWVINSAKLLCWDPR